MNLIFDAQQQMDIGATGTGNAGKDAAAEAEAEEARKRAEEKSKYAKGKQHAARSIWEDPADAVSLHSDLDTEQELQHIQLQAARAEEEEDSDDEAGSADGAQQEGVSRIENQLLRGRKQYRLVEISFPATIIKAQGINRLRWDFVIITLAVYQAVTIPISIAFAPDDFSSPTMKTIDSIIDLVFCMDIVLNFRTSFIE